MSSVETGLLVIIEPLFSVPVKILRAFQQVVVVDHF